MVIMRLTLHNVLGFDDLSLDFSYPKKLAKNSIDGEYLLGIPSFRFKKVNIVFGSNSNGKSTLGKAIWHTVMFLRNKESKQIIDLMSNNKDETTIGMDYVIKQKSKYIMNRILIQIKKTGNQDSSFSVKMSYSHVTLRSGDTYESACNDLVEVADNIDYLECLNLIGHKGGWLIAAPVTEESFDYFNLELEKKERDEFAGILSKVLMSLDPNINSVSQSQEVDNAYIVTFDDGKNTIVKNMDKISDIPFLSTGTRYGFQIASVVYAIGKKKNGLYYVDELFSYINSDIETVCLNIMISLLGDCEQLFFTTHNADILAAPFPLHSFLFLGKNKADNKYVIHSVCASDVEKRNNVVVKNLFENDYFNVSPSVDKLFEIEEHFHND